MAEKKKILYIVEAMGGGVFTYIVDLANELVNSYDMYIAYAVRKQTPQNYKDYFDKRIHLIEVKNFGRVIDPAKDIAAFFEVKKIEAKIKPSDVAFLRLGLDATVKFTAYDFSNNKEVILGRTYIENEFGHAFQRYYDQNNSNRQSMGATRGFIDEYLCIDGRPIYVGGSEGNYEENPNFEGYGMWRELENRDPRLTQTICRPGEHVTIYEGGIVSLDENGINYPKINYNTNGSTVTGYRVIKHWMGDMEEQDRTTNGIQAAIEFRYGELLLMYAEAKYELEGTLSQADVDMTINALRERAGFDFVKYQHIGNH